MAEPTLDELRHLVDKLPPHDQARLLASLALRVAQTVESRATQANGISQEPTETWGSSSVWETS